MNRADDEQLEGSGFIFEEVSDVKFEVYKINDIQASSYLPLPNKYKNSHSSQPHMDIVLHQ